MDARRPGAHVQTMIPDEHAEVIRGFEACDLPRDTFHHFHHVLVTWHYLRTMPVAEALATLVARLRAFSAAQGVPDRYHETVTCAWFYLIGERLERTGRDLSWEEFAAANPDLLDGTAMEGYYRPGTFDDPVARRVFVLPDRRLDGEGR